MPPPPDMTKGMCRASMVACLVDSECCSGHCTSLFGCE
jgi:hypothetical protein